MDTKNIVILGCGGIGRAAGLILAAGDAMNVHIYLGDINQSAIDEATQFVAEGSGKADVVEGFLMSKDGVSDAMQNALTNGHIIMDCLPGALAPRMAQLAKDNGMHYVNLTEYVAETNQIIDLAQDAETGFVLQTGVAPGFVNILGNLLYQQFQERYDTDELDLMEMKVGALSQNASAPHFYAFTWSPIGVSTEYIKDAIVVENHEIKTIPSLSDTQQLVIEGKMYEDDFTSGGAADFPQAFADKVANIHYKTLRFPGHYAWAKEQIKSYAGADDITQKFEEQMLNEIPSVENDHIIIYVRVKGKDATGRIRAIDKVVNVYPQLVGTNPLRAIQSTTAAPMCECARMLLQGEMKPGVNLQSQIDPKSFINGPYIKMIYGDLS